MNFFSVECLKYVSRFREKNTNCTKLTLEDEEEEEDELEDEGDADDAKLVLFRLSMVLLELSLTSARVLLQFVSVVP